MSFRGWQKVTINTPNETVGGIAPVIISASRATDIPAFYADWFMHRLRTGYVKWFNRFNGEYKLRFQGSREHQAILDLLIFFEVSSIHGKP